MLWCLQSESNKVSVQVYLCMHSSSVCVCVCVEVGMCTVYVSAYFKCTSWACEVVCMCVSLLVWIVPMPIILQIMGVACDTNIWVCPNLKGYCIYFTVTIKERLYNLSIVYNQILTKLTQQI